MKVDVFDAWLQQAQVTYSSLFSVFAFGIVRIVFNDL